MMATTNPELIYTIVEHKHPKPRYKAHYGGPQPAEDDAYAEVVFSRYHGTATNKCKVWRWEHIGTASDIIAYRVLENDE